MTRVTIGLTILGLVILFVAYGKGVRVIHGGDVLGHMYWATAALFFVALFIGIAMLDAHSSKVNDLPPETIQCLSLPRWKGLLMTEE